MFVRPVDVDVYISSLVCIPTSAQMAVLKKHHRAAHHGHYYECLVKFKGVAYNKVIGKDCRRVLLVALCVQYSKSCQMLLVIR